MVVVFVHKHECVQLYWVVLRSDTSSARLLTGYTSSCCVFFWYRQDSVSPLLPTGRFPSALSLLLLLSVLYPGLDFFLAGIVK